MSLPCPSFKVVILGDSSVGKTSLVHRFTTSEFDNQLSSTIGAAFITKELESTDKSKRINLEIWDTAGQERYKSLTPMYYRNSKVALVCYDLHNPSTFDKALYWIDQLKLNNETNNEIIIYLIGTKCDLVTNPMILGVNDFLEMNPKIKHFHTSAKNGQGIHDIFQDIINSIPPEFFLEYYESLKTDKKVFLNNQFQGKSCC